MAELGTSGNPLRVCVVGAGPAGFYAAEALFRSDLEVHIDMLERLPVPFGLVRYGVAPDHPKLKQTTKVFERIAGHDNFRFLGNIAMGEALRLEQVQQHCHAVIYCSGAPADRSLGIPGEDLPGSHTATEFVGWYNGHPDFRDREFDLSTDTAVIIGQGNVAADLVRILGKRPDDLKTTDITAHALATLRESGVKNIHVIGRRGPAQAKFTVQELRELGEIPGAFVEIHDAALDLNAASLKELESKKNFGAAKNVKIMREWAQRPKTEHERRIVFHFLESPVEIRGEGRVQELVLRKNTLEGSAFKQSAQATDEQSTLACGLIFRSIGYRGLPLEDLPFDEAKAVLANEVGRVNGQPGVYSAGWIKRGATGIIGTNRACAVETVGNLIDDIDKLDATHKPGLEPLRARLIEQGHQVVSYADWEKIDAAEAERGAAADKPREKFTTVADMLEALS